MEQSVGAPRCVCDGLHWESIQCPRCSFLHVALFHPGHNRMFQQDDAPCQTSSAGTTICFGSFFSLFNNKQKRSSHAYWIPKMFFFFTNSSWKYLILCTIVRLSKHQFSPIDIKSEKYNTVLLFLYNSNWIFVIWVIWCSHKCYAKFSSTWKLTFPPAFFLLHEVLGWQMFDFEDELRSDTCQKVEEKMQISARCYSCSAWQNIFPLISFFPPADGRSSHALRTIFPADVFSAGVGQRLGSLGSTDDRTQSTGVATHLSKQRLEDVCRTLNCLFETNIWKCLGSSERHHEVPFYIYWYFTICGHATQFKP